MVEKCANPSCSTPFRRVGRGKLFAFEVRASGRSPHRVLAARSTKPGSTSLFFWLCAICSLTITLGLDNAGRLTFESLQESIGVDGGPLNHAGVE
jgi:hypothetical protein